MFPKESRVLIADDSLVVRRSIRNMFNDLNFSLVEEAKDGQLALEQIISKAGTGEAFSLIISDINMPNMDGLHLIKELRSNPGLVNLPFIFVTARGQEKDIEEGLALGANSYITKPFTKEDLLNSLLEVWEKIKS